MNSDPWLLKASKQSSTIVIHHSAYHLAWPRDLAYLEIILDVDPCFVV
jgi:hypothetical protein